MMDTEKGAFEYGGYHFIPERQFTPEENDFFKIAKRQRRDPDLGICEKGYGPSQHEYSYAGFYDASPDKTCDLFRCVENGKLYIPCAHDLQEYMEDGPTQESEPDLPDEDMPPENEIRKAGDYEVIQAITLGDKEVVLGENFQAPPDERYMCAFCRHTDVALFYEETTAYNSYLDAAKDFADRLKEQCIRLEVEMRQPAADGIDDSPITADGCTVIDGNDDLRNQFVVIRQDALRREYRAATHQLKFCTGGFGAMPHARGRACFCVDLYTGKESRFERQDILGTMTKAQLPEWAKRGYEKYRQAKNRSEGREAR